MKLDLSALTISATKPKGKPARMLADLGVGILPIEDESVRRSGTSSPAKAEDEGPLRAQQASRC